MHSNKCFNSPSCKKKIKKYFKLYQFYIKTERIKPTFMEYTWRKPSRNNKIAASLTNGLWEYFNTKVLCKCIIIYKKKNQKIKKKKAISTICTLEIPENKWTNLIQDLT